MIVLSIKSVLQNYSNEESDPKNLKKVAKALAATQSLQKFTFKVSLLVINCIVNLR